MRESRLDHRIVIAAPLAIVWEAIADLTAVQAYNPGRHGGASSRPAQRRRGGPQLHHQAGRTGRAGRRLGRRKRSRCSSSPAHGRSDRCAGAPSLPTGGRRRRRPGTGLCAEYGVVGALLDALAMRGKWTNPSPGSSRRSSPIAKEASRWRYVTPPRRAVPGGDCPLHSRSGGGAGPHVRGVRAVGRPKDLRHAASRRTRREARSRALQGSVEGKIARSSTRARPPDEGMGERRRRAIAPVVVAGGRSRSLCRRPGWR